MISPESKFHTASALNKYIPERNKHDTLCTEQSAQAAKNFYLTVLGPRRQYPFLPPRGPDLGAGHDGQGCQRGGEEGQVQGCHGEAGQAHQGEHHR